MPGMVDASSTLTNATTVLETVVEDVSGRLAKHPVDAGNPFRRGISGPIPSLDAQPEMEIGVADDAKAGFGSVGRLNVANGPLVDPVETLDDEAAATETDVDVALEMSDVPEAETASIPTFHLPPSTNLCFPAIDAMPTSPLP